MAGKYSLLITAETAKRYANAALLEAADVTIAQAVVGTVSTLTADLIEAADTCTSTAAVLVQASASMFDADNMSSDVDLYINIVDGDMFEAADFCTGSIIDLAEFRRRKLTIARYEQPRTRIARQILK